MEYGTSDLDNNSIGKSSLSKFGKNNLENTICGLPIKLILISRVTKHKTLLKLQKKVCLASRSILMNTVWVNSNIILQLLTISNLRINLQSNFYCFKFDLFATGHRQHKYNLNSN